MSDLETSPVASERSFSPKGGETDTRIGPLSLDRQGLPDQAAIDHLYEERDFQRACQAYLWALPIIGYAQWQNQHETVFGARDGDIVQYVSPRDKLGLITANGTTPYIVGFVNLARTGPLVVDYPAGETAGGCGDFWQRSIVDFGLTGPDKGNGGRYLILGPGQDAPKGFAADHVVRSPTFNIMHATRILATDPDEAARVLAGYQAYPAQDAAAPRKTRVVRPEGRAWSGTHPTGMAYWERLDAILQVEPVKEEDRLIMAMLKPLGLEKGKPFQPTSVQAKALADGARIGRLMAIANSFDKRFATATYRGRWDRVVNVDLSQQSEFYSELDERASWFYEAVGLSAGMTTHTPGEGQAYLSTYRDAAGRWLDGGKTYRLHVPPNVPVGQWWSVTLYDIETRCFIDTPLDKVDRSSRHDLATNPDGSIDLVFGPEPPEGAPESNWIPTVPGRAWFTYFRLYAPLEAYFDASWALPDIEEV
ncbi:DUF1254 domain-containing protein [Caulobacter sp. Root1455]|uniref:DUF1254 domain-containing protein n=1 Tax=Caulobacter sp. Root1455 TaxID=1736465 RepID=UPI0009EC3354|nr:DUF1254 domain-containing protein [Caulobacter sp. Root1455]